MGDVYRAIRLGHWLGADPLPRNRSLLRNASGGYPPGRWSDTSQDALYTSHLPATAFVEIAQRYAPGSNARSILEAQGVQLWLVVVALAKPPPRGTAFDGRKSPSALWRRYMHPAAVPNAYRASQVFAARQAAAGRTCLIVPSAPAYNASPRSWQWNAVYLIGHPGQYRPADLPDKTGLTEVLRRRVV